LPENEKNPPSSRSQRAGFCVGGLVVFEDDATDSIPQVKV